MSSLGLSREVFGFALASSLSDSSVGYPSWNFALLSTVAFFSLHINDNGTIAQDSAWSVWNSSALTGLLSTAHAHGGKVVVTIDLQDFQPGTPDMCAGLMNHSEVVAQTVAQVNAKGVDGVNVDFEGLNGTCSNGETSRSMMTAFIKQLRSDIPVDSYLSVDTYASSAGDRYGFFDVAGMSPYVDSFFVMAYDLEYSNYHYRPPGCPSFCLGPTAPLAAYHYSDSSTASEYLSLVPASKVILGIPYYGRKACVAGSGPNAIPVGGVTADTYLDASQEGRAAGVTPGSYVTHRDANDPSGQERWDTWHNFNLGCTRELYWDDAVSLARKYDLVNADGLRGVGIWTLNYGGGAPELWSALRTHFGACSGVTSGVNPASPQPRGAIVTIDSVASCPDANPMYAFWVQYPGATSYTLVQQYSSSATFTWKTAAMPQGTYRINVWVRDALSLGAHSNVSGSWDAYNAGLLYRLTSGCPSVSEVASPPTAPAGAAVTVTATASGCPNPRYQFWILSPGASRYTLVQPYSPARSFTWYTAGNLPGIYRIAVWSNDSASTGLSGNPWGRWDSYDANLLIWLTPSCTSVKATPSAPIATAGATLMITAASTGCPSPRYAFWVLSPGARSYALVQSYSSKATFTWSTAGNGSGSYRINVWVQDASSTGLSGNSYGRWDTYNATLTISIT